MLLSLLLTARVVSQGTINFANVVSGTAIQAYVNRSDDLSPAGRLGTGYWAQLYVGPADTPETSLTAVGVPVEFRNSAITGAPTGRLSGGGVVVPFLPGGYDAVVQMRAWSGAAGRSYEAARATGFNYGQSGLITIVLGGGGITPSLPVDLWGLQPFTVLVPEPPTAVLCALGLAILWVARHGERCALLTAIGGGRDDSRGSSTRSR